MYVVHGTIQTLSENVCLALHYHIYLFFLK